MSFQGRKALALIVAGLLACIGPASAATTCPLLRAHYHLSANPHFTLSFTRLPKSDAVLTDVALKLTPPAGPSYWYFFDGGSARYVNMISTTDPAAPGWHIEPDGGDRRSRPLGEMHYYAWSGNYRFDESMPKTSTPAPQQIFLPDLAEIMWYAANPRISVPYGVFEFDGCAPR